MQRVTILKAEPPNKNEIITRLAKMIDDVWDRDQKNCRLQQACNSQKTYHIGGKA